jgi:hypothetical protein
MWQRLRIAENARVDAPSTRGAESPNETDPGPVQSNRFDGRGSSRAEARLISVLHIARPGDLCLSDVRLVVNPFVLGIVLVAIADDHQALGVLMD